MPQFRKQPDLVINREVCVGEDAYQPSIYFIDEYQRLLVYGMKITERKKMEAALHESEERYKELVENANSIIIKMDRSGNIIFFNEFAQKFFGYSLDEILGRDARILLPKIERGSGRDLQEMADVILDNPDDFVENINENVLKRRSMPS